MPLTALLERENGLTSLKGQKSVSSLQHPLPPPFSALAERCVALSSGLDGEGAQVSPQQSFLKQPPRAVGQLPPRPPFFGDTAHSSLGGA